MPGKTYNPPKNYIASSFPNQIDGGNGNAFSLPKKVSDLTATTKKLANITRVSLLSIINAFTTVQDNILEQMSSYQYKPVLDTEIEESGEEAESDELDLDYESAVDIAVATNKSIIETLLRWVQDKAGVDIFKYIDVKQDNAKAEIDLKDKESEEAKEHVKTLLIQACSLDKNIAELYQSFKELVTVESELEEIRQSIIELLGWNSKPEEKISTFEHDREVSEWAKKAINGSLMLKNVVMNAEKLRELKNIDSQDIADAKADALQAKENTAQLTIDFSSFSKNMSSSISGLEGSLKSKADISIVGDIDIFDLGDKEIKPNLANLLAEAVKMIGEEPKYGFVPILFTANETGIEGVYSFKSGDEDSAYYQISKLSSLQNLSLYRFDNNSNSYIPLYIKSTQYSNHVNKVTDHPEYSFVEYDLGEDESDGKDIVRIYTLAPVVAGSGLKAVNSVLQQTLLATKSISADRLKVNLIQAGATLAETSIADMGAISLKKAEINTIIGNGITKPTVIGGTTGPVIIKIPENGHL